MDGALLLIARGAEPSSVAESLGLIGDQRQLTRQLIRFTHQGYLDAVRAAQLRPHGTRSRYGAGCRCDDCRRAQADGYRARHESPLPNGAFKRTRVMDERDQEWREENEYRPLFRSRYRQTLKEASHHRQEWTSAQLVIAAREDLDAWEVAAMTGRTINAVHSMRAKLKVDPRMRAAAEVDDRWND